MITSLRTLFTDRIPYKWLVAMAFVSGLFLEILDMTVLNTALPILGEHFGAELPELQWLVTAYLVSLAGFIPASGWVADRFGDKQTFVFALGVYTAANLWAGFAGSMGELIAARVVQGVGGGLLTPVGMAMLFRAFPVAERGGDRSTVVILGVGASLVVAFVVAELRVRAPMIDVRLLRERTFAIGNAALLPAAGATMGALFVVPLLVQTHRGLSATESGLLTAFQAIGMLTLLPFTNRLFQRFGGRTLLVTGFTLITASQFALMLLGPTTSLSVIRASMFLMGMAGALVMVPLQAMAFSRISLPDTARASALFSTTRQVAASLGVAVIATTLTVRTAVHVADLPAQASAAQRSAAVFGAYQDVFLVSGLLGILGVGLALLLTGGGVGPAGRVGRSS